MRPPSADHAVAAGDAQHLAGHMAGTAGSQEDNGVGNVLRTADFAQRHRLGGLFDLFGAEHAVRIGPHAAAAHLVGAGRDRHAGADHVATDPEAPVFLCDRLHEAVDSILDAGVNFSHEKTHSNLFGMYHTSGSTTWGLGFNYQSVTINGMYTTATAALGAYANGNFEIGLQVKLRK